MANQVGKFYHRHANSYSRPLPSWVCPVSERATV